MAMARMTSQSRLRLFEPPPSTEAKVLFGSDFPFTTTGDSLAGVRGMNAILAQSGLPPIPAEVIEGIIHRDTLGLLGLKPPGNKAANKRIDG